MNVQRIKLYLITVLMVVAFFYFYLKPSSKHHIWICQPKDKGFKRLYKVFFSKEDGCLIRDSNYWVSEDLEKENNVIIYGIDFVILEGLEKPEEFITVAMDSKKRGIILKADGLSIEDYVYRFNKIIEKTNFSLDLDDKKATDSYLDFHIQSLFQGKYTDAREGEIFVNSQDQSITVTLEQTTKTLHFKKKRFRKYKETFEREGYAVTPLGVTYNIIVSPKGTKKIFWLSFHADHHGRIDISVERLN